MILFFLLLFSLSIYLNACEFHLQHKIHTQPIPTNIECYMGVDIGGTNSDFGIFKIHKNTPSLLFSLHTQTQAITNFNAAMARIISFIQDQYNITIKHVCIGAPGATTKEKNYSAVKGLFDIKSEELIKQHNFTCAPIINDFSIIPYGLDLIKHESIVSLCDVKPEIKGCRAIIGAGTGLGTAIATWSDGLERYVSSASEGGAIDFAPLNKFEYDLANHLKHIMGLKTVAWTHFVSGKGIMRIYSMLKLSNKYKDSLFLDMHDPAIIFAHPEDELCKATMELYFNLYARFARNYIFTTLPYGGLYIAGGIAAKNVDLFSSLFMKEYNNCQEQGLKKILDRIPIFIISDYNVSLYGAIQYLLHEYIKK